MKRIPAILLLLIFLYSTIGYYPAFVISKYNMHKNFKEKKKKNIPEDEIASIMLTDEVLNKLKWKADDEFELEDQMYDIISKETNSEGLVLLRCLPDPKEKKLFDNFFQWINSTNDDENNAKDNSNVLIYFSLDYLAPSKLKRDYFSMTDLHYFPQESSYKSYYPENPSPPPELA